MNILYSVRITKDGKFHAYLSHRDRKSWSRRQAQRHVAEAKTLSHFKGCQFYIERDGLIWGKVNGKWGWYQQK